MSTTTACKNPPNEGIKIRKYKNNLPEVVFISELLNSGSSQDAQIIARIERNQDNSNCYKST
jgi:hypothetical protein